MATKKLGLGKGLDALLSASLTPVRVAVEPAEAALTEALGSNASTSNTNGLLELEVTKLKPGKYQPRRHISQTELEALADSIRTQGVIQPIIVRKLNKDFYEIIAGERRWRAAQLADLQTIPVIIKEISDEKAMVIGLIENIQREDLNPLEEAQALDRLVKEFNLTHVQIAEAVGKSRTTVTNLLRLLVLAEDVKIMLEKGQLEVGHAKVLLGLRAHEQSVVAKTVVARGLSVRDTERLVANMLADASKPNRVQVLDPNIRKLQNSLSEKLGAIVEIQHGQQGKGKIVIQYNSLDELDGILEHIK
jgi:ParB family chromosome partitioning protein